MEFALRVALSFLVGGAYVSGIIWCSEKLGSKVGGALAGIPNTILVSLAFICLTTNAHSTQISATIIPVMIVAALFYSWVFVQVSGRGKATRGPLFATLIAVFAWLILALVLRSSLSNASFVYVVVLSMFGTGLFYVLFQKYPGIKPKKIPTSNSVYIVRFLTGGAIVAGAVIAAHYSGPIWGGVVGSFPALSMTLYFLNRSQGPEFTKSVVKRLPLSVISTILFIVVLELTLTRVNTPLSFLIAIACALMYTYILLNARSRLA